MSRKKASDTEWKEAAEATLTTTLKALETVASDCRDAKTLESIAKTVGDIVGAGNYFKRGAKVAPAQDGDDDE